MAKTLNIAYIGFGKSVNRYHLPYVHLRGDQFHVARVVTPHPGKRADDEAPLRADGTVFSSDLTAVTSDPTIDLAVVVTPAPTHYALAKQLLLAGKHVLSDKPITSTLAEAQELTALAADKNLIYMPFQNRRFDSDFLTVKKVLNTGYIGDLLDITVTMTHFRPQDGATDGSAYDGAWYGHGVHLVDQMVALFGKPNRVQYDIRATRVPSSPVDDYFSVNLLYPTFRATVQASELALAPQPKWRLNGTRGSFIKQNVDQQENDLKAGILPGTPDFGADAPADYGQLTYVNQNGDLIQKTLPTVPGDYGRVYDSLYATLTTGAPQLISAPQFLTVIETLENGVK